MDYRSDLAPEASKKTAAAVLIAPAERNAADAPGPGSSSQQDRHERFRNSLPHPPAGTGHIVNEAPASPPPFLSNREIEQVGGPVSVAWREGTLTRAKELESLCASIVANNKPLQDGNILARSIYFHIDAARRRSRRGVESQEAPSFAPLRTPAGTRHEQSRRR
jgi:hypothetical protein